MSEGLVIDSKTTLSMAVFIGFADRPSFIRIPFIPVSEEQPNIKWSFSVQAMIPFQSNTPLPDETSLALAPQPSDEIIIPINQYATVNLQVNVLREADGLLFAIDRSGSNVPDWENVFVTLLAMKADNTFGHPVFNDVLGKPDEPARIARVPLAALIGLTPEEPSPAAIPFQDFTSSIADSIKKAQAQIQSKLGNELFGLDLENFEIKTPYVVNINSNNELIMTKPPTEPVGNYEPAFSKLTFRKTVKLD